MVDWCTAGIGMPDFVAWLYHVWHAREASVIFR
jgi:hypothetical protein